MDLRLFSLARLFTIGLESFEPTRWGGFAGSVLSIGQPDRNLKAVNAFQILLEFFMFDV